jgi:hypothetical protein
MTADKTLLHVILHQSIHAHVVVNSEFLRLAQSSIPEIDGLNRVEGFSRIYIP